MAMRGCTSRSTSRLAHVRRASWTVIRRTFAAAHRRSQVRLKFRGSIGVPYLVVKTSPESCHFCPAAFRASS